MNILVIEDDAILTSLLVRRLGSEGHTVFVAVDGKSARSAFQRESFDVVLLDLFLPDGPGQDLIPGFGLLRPGIPVITMTGFNSRELEAEVRRHGVLFYLIKPFDLNTLLSILGHIARRRQKEKADSNSYQEML